MAMIVRWCSRILLALVLTSCSRSSTPAPAAVDGSAAGPLAPAAATSGEPAGDVAVNDGDYTFAIETRDHELWLHVDGELYTVKAKDGRVLARAIDEARLRSDYPELHDLVHGGVDY